MSSEAAEAVAAMLASREQERQVRYERRLMADGQLAEVKADLKEQRMFGLKRRHAGKLARNRTAQPLV